MDIVTGYKNKILVILIIFSITISSGCITDSNIKDSDSYKNVITYGTFDINSMYPYSINVYNKNVLLSNIYNGLVEFDEIFQIIPSLAVSWTNLDDYTWRFNLRENVKFHNGINFTAEDVKYSLNSSIYSTFKSFLKDVKIIDNYTIDVLTYEPFPGLLQRFAHTFIVFPKDYFYDNEQKNPIGTGPYKFAEYINNNYTKIEIFSEYWGEKPEIDIVIFRLIEDQEIRINKLTNGEINIAEYNIDNNIDILKNNSDLNILKYPPLSTYIIGFDVRENNSYGFSDGKNPTSDLRVRKAFYHAIDIEPLINGPFKGYAKPASQLLTPYVFGYNPDIKRLSYNTSLAKELLNESGYNNGFEIEMDCITEGYEYNKINCELIKEQLSEVGIKIKINNLSIEDFNKKVIFDKNTSLWLVGWGTVSIDGGFVYDLFIRTFGENILGYYNSGHYSNSKVDSIGIEASSEMNPTFRINLLQEGFKIAHVDDIFTIPLFSQELLILTNDIVMIPRADLRFIAKDITFL
jgi:peptide/nickel transport system substrate-binding protein